MNTRAFAVALIGLGTLGSSFEGAAGTFRLYPQVVEIAEVGETTNLVLQTDAGSMVFYPPNGWRMRVEPAESQIVWTSADYTSELRLKVVPDPDGAMRTDLATKCRERLTEQDPALKIVHEFTCYTAGQTGQAFDVQRETPAGEVVTGRVAYIPLPGAVADLRLMNPAGQREQRQTELVMFLNSFRVMERPASASVETAGAAVEPSSEEKSK